jgi:raffinose/stachyose/melibiose transport system substrate-binding protein
MKRLIVLLLLFSSLFLIAANGGEEKKEASTTGVTNLRIYAQGLAPREQLESERVTPPQYLWALRDEYQALHPDVTIEFIPEIATGYEEWFMTQMTGGTAPDTVWIQRSYVNRDYKKGWLSDLTDELAKPNPYAPSYDNWYDVFQPQVIESGRAPDDRIYMITGDIVGTGIFYNKDLFKKAGIKSEPTTWKEFLEAQKKLKAIRVIPFSTSMDMSGPGRMYGSWFFREIQDVMYNAKFEDIKQGKVVRTWKPGEAINTIDMVNAILDGRYAATQPEFKETLRIIKDWSQYWPEGFQSYPDDNILDSWLQGESAMGWFGSWVTKSVNSDPIRDFEWGVLEEIPTITKDTSPFGGAGFPVMGGVGGAFQYAIPEATKDRGTFEQTVDWMMFMTEPRNLVETLNDHGGFAPGVRDTTGAMEQLGVYTKMMEKYGTEVIEPIDSMLTREFLDEFFVLLQLYLIDQQDLDTTCELIQEEMVVAAERLIQENPDWRK